MTNISPEQLTLKPLDKINFQDVQGFSCGNRLIDAYLKSEYCALRDHKMGIASTTVLILDERIVAFVTASCTQVRIPESDYDMFDTGDFYVPAIEVKYLAVSENYQRRGIGKIILNIIVSKTYELSAMFACRYIFLWSVPEEVALKLYNDHFFEDTGVKNNEGSHLMLFQVPEDIEDDEY